MENEESYPYTSLCQVSYNDVGRARAYRLADIDGDEIHEAPFSYYRWLPVNNNTLPIGFIGIWGWRTEPNRKPDGKEYAVAKFYPDKIPIEIIFLDDCSDDTDLKKRLINGVGISLSSGKALISYAVDQENYCGVLCTARDFDPNGKIKKGALPSFEFTERNVIRVDKKIFYSRLTLGAPTKTFYTMKFSKLIAEGIVSRAKKLTAIGRKDRRVIREILSTFRAEDFYGNIAKACNCSIEEVRPHVDVFINDAQKFLAPEAFDDELLTTVIENCPVLLARCQTVIEEKWTAENADKISAANVELDRIKRETAAAISEANAQLDRIGRDIADLTKRRAELEQEIEYLQSARDDFSARPIPPPASQKFYRPGRAIEGAAPAADINDFIYAFEDALGMTGKETYPTLNTIDGFARYLRSAFDNDTPLLLTGTRARAVVDAFSIALTGRTAALFDCAGVKCLDDLNDCASADDQIIALLNPFAPDFIACLPELIGIKGKFFFALHPFVDDLRLEPPELYNYFLPVFTDLIFDDRTADNRARKILRTSNVSKEYAVLFAKFPLAYVKGRGKKFLDEFKGDKDIGDRLRTFLGDDDE